MTDKQVDKSHYEFSKYVHKRRWVSMWHQLDEVIKLKPEHVLEVGPGPGLFKAMAETMGIHVETLDIDSELQPDHLASVFEMPFEDRSFDIVCAFQMLEHLPFTDSQRAFREMTRVARKALVISLPDAATRWPVSVHIPKLGQFRLLIPRPQLHAAIHIFDGEHFWEINKKHYSLDRVKADLFGLDELILRNTYRVFENPRHRFFIFEKII